MESTVFNIPDHMSRCYFFANIFTSKFLLIAVQKSGKEVGRKGRPAARELGTKCGSGVKG